MAKQQNFYKSPIVAAWLATIPARRKSRAINEALERDIARREEQETLLGLLHGVVNSVDGLTEVIAGLAAEVILKREVKQ